MGTLPLIGSKWTKRQNFILLNAKISRQSLEVGIFATKFVPIKEIPFPNISQIF